MKTNRSVPPLTVVPILVYPDVRAAVAFLTAAFGFLCLMNKAPHPNAAKLFLNWLASKDGEEAFAHAQDGASLRTDVKYDGVPDFLFPQKGVSYMDTSDWKFVTEQHQSAMTKVQELLGK